MSVFRRCLLLALVALATAGAARGEATLPGALETIGAEAFAGTGLEAVTLPDALTFIDDTAFEGSALAAVTAREGTYAWKWAEARGFLRREDPGDAPKPSRVQGVVRIYLQCDGKGAVCRDKNHTGHYELELAGKDVLRFDGRDFRNPVFSYAAGDGGAGQVTVYGADAVPYRNVRLYTFAFDTTGEKAKEMLDRLQNGFLRTGSEKRAKHGYTYDVGKGAYKKYDVHRANCFTAVAAWCKWLGYGKLGKIVDAAGSYTDYLAWKLFDRYGASWKYQGRY